jgi:hypothetical protein
MYFRPPSANRLLPWTAKGGGFISKNKKICEIAEAVEKPFSRLLNL